MTNGTTPANVKINCPFCNQQVVDTIYYPPVTQISVSRAAGRTAKRFYTTQEKYEIISDCSNCGKTKSEIKRALKEGTPEDKERRKKRYEEIMKLREEMIKRS